MSTIEATSSLHQARTLQVFLTRGVVAIAWAVVFAAASHSLTTAVTVGAGVLLVLYPLIDVVASVIDARSQQGSARQLLLAGAAVSAAAAVALGVAATGSVADVLTVFGVWAAISGAAQLVVALRRRALLGNQWPMLLAGGGSVIGGLPAMGRYPGASGRRDQGRDRRRTAGNRPGGRTRPGRLRRPRSCDRAGV